VTRNVWNPHFERSNPAFAPLAEAIAPFRANHHWPTLDEWNAAFPGEIRSATGARITFVAQPPRRRSGRRDLASLYDERIFARGEVQSRAHSWHDFFNMLVWASFPATKRAINARQRAALVARIDPLLRGGPLRLPAARTSEQDALAMLDEGGAIVVRRDAAPIEIDAIPVAVANGDARVLLIGHAIYEHLVVGSGPVRAFLQIVASDPSLPNDVLCHEADAQLARTLESTPLVYDRSMLGLSIVDTLFRRPT
jgi:hypothetical protein